MALCFLNDVSVRLGTLEGREEEKVTRYDSYNETVSPGSLS